MTELLRTALFDMHVELGAKMVPFAGFEMPVQYPLGVMNEHLHTRAKAGLFDVSHMGQVILRAPDGAAVTAALALESLVPVDLAILKPGRQRYALFTDDAGHLLDDLMVTNRDDHLYVVVNAGCRNEDIAHMRARLAGLVEVIEITDRALIALQGPAAEGVLAAHVPGAADMKFMDSLVFDSGFGTLWISRSGYTGEDGYEISVADDQARALCAALLADENVEAIGLGARDSLRLEAGLCLYGHDIDTTTTPVEAALEWAMQKSRRSGGARAGGFPGADVILAELENGATRRRVGLLPTGRAPMREGVPLFASEDGGAPIGSITSGGFGPSIGAPIAMGYVSIDHAATGTQIWGELRGKRLPLTVADMPFRPSTYKR